jgi:hypothetical protein
MSRASAADPDRLAISSLRNLPQPRERRERLPLVLMKTHDRQHKTKDERPSRETLSSLLSPTQIPEPQGGLERTMHDPRPRATATHP